MASGSSPLGYTTDAEAPCPQPPSCPPGRQALLRVWQWRPEEGGKEGGREGGREGDVPTFFFSLSFHFLFLPPFLPPSLPTYLPTYLQVGLPLPRGWAVRVALLHDRRPEHVLRQGGREGGREREREGGKEDWSAKVGGERRNVSQPDPPSLPPSLPPYLEGHQSQGMGKQRGIPTRPLVRATGRPIIV